MSLDKLVDSSQLDTDLTSVANAIRTKSGTSAQLAFPADFISAINAISGGGGQFNLLASGDHTVASDLGTSNMVIPISVSSTPCLYFVVADQKPSSGTYAWVRLAYALPQSIVDTFPSFTEIVYTSNGSNTFYFARSATNSSNSALPITLDSISAPTKITCVRYSNGYPIKAGTYHWYCWGL